MASDSVRRNFSITEKVDRILNEKSEEWDMSRSEIVVNAVLEYTDHDRTARIEQKLDRLLEGVEGGPPHTSESDTPEKERDSDESSEGENELPADLLPEDTSSPTKTRANQFFNYLIRDCRDQPLVTTSDIEDAIDAVWGDCTDHMRNKHVPKIKDRLDDSGLKKHPQKEVWYLDEGKYLDHLSSQWEDVETTLKKGDPPQDVAWDVDGSSETAWIEEAMARADEMRDVVIDEDIESEENIEELYEEGQQRLEDTTANW